MSIINTLSVGVSVQAGEAFFKKRRGAVTPEHLREDSLTEQWQVALPHLVGSGTCSSNAYCCVISLLYALYSEFIKFEPESVDRSDFIKLRHELVRNVRCLC